MKVLAFSVKEWRDGGKERWEYHVGLHICVEEKKNRSSLVKRTMNREGDGERLERECKGKLWGNYTRVRSHGPQGRTAGATPASFRPPCRFTTSIQLQGLNLRTMKVQMQCSNFGQINVSWLLFLKGHLEENISSQNVALQELWGSSCPLK